jgi:general secretion pathway protein E
MDVNIITVEDPVEYRLPGINQVQVHAKAGLNFAAILPAILRSDPDVVMIGEIRDRATAQLAIEAALTGHLVLSTLHTNDAPSAITRLIDIGVPAYLLQSTILGVMAQRLVRTLCTHCKTPHPLDPAAWDTLVAPWKAKRPTQQTYTAKGCLECRMTGYMGRVGIYETMVMTPPLKNALTGGTSLDELRERAYQDGMKPLRLSGALKVASGLTTIEEVTKSAPPPDRAATSATKRAT